MTGFVCCFSLGENRDECVVEHPICDVVNSLMRLDENNFKICKRDNYRNHRQLGLKVGGFEKVFHYNLDDEVALLTSHHSFEVQRSSENFLLKELVAFIERNIELNLNFHLRNGSEEMKRSVDRVSIQHRHRQIAVLLIVPDSNVVDDDDALLC